MSLCHLPSLPARSACLKLRRAQQETKQLPRSGRKPLVTGFRIPVLLRSWGSHLPPLRLSGEQLERAEPIQVSVPLGIPGQGCGVGNETPAVSVDVGLLALVAAQEPHRGTARHYHASEFQPRLLLARFGSHTETSPGGTISGKNPTILPNLPRPRLHRLREHLFLTTRIVPLPAAPDKSREEA